MTLEDFITDHKLEIQIILQHAEKGTVPCWCAYLRHKYDYRIEILKDKEVIYAPYGYPEAFVIPGCGKNPNDALKNLAEVIRGMTISFIPYINDNETNLKAHSIEVPEDLVYNPWIYAVYHDVEEFYKDEEKPENIR